MDPRARESRPSKSPRASPCSEYCPAWVVCGASPFVAPCLIRVHRRFGASARSAHPPDHPGCRRPQAAYWQEKLRAGAGTVVPRGTVVLGVSEVTTHADDAHQKNSGRLGGVRNRRKNSAQRREERRETRRCMRSDRGEEPRSSPPRRDRPQPPPSSVAWWAPFVRRSVVAGFDRALCTGCVRAGLERRRRRQRARHALRVREGLARGRGRARARPSRQARGRRGEAREEGRRRSSSSSRARAVDLARSISRADDDDARASGGTARGGGTCDAVVRGAPRSGSRVPIDRTPVAA